MLTREQLAKAIEGKRDAVAYYEYAKTLTGDEKHRKTLDGIIKDEQKHLAKFSELYRRKFGGQVEGSPAMPEVHEFNAALRMAVSDELDAYEFYRDIYMDCTSEQVRVPFFEAMTDENEHAIRLNLMYTEEIEKRTV